MNIMTEYQREIAAYHMPLVKEVIQKRIKIAGLPLLTYDDFYAVGCEALCRAAIAYKPELGEFEPLACRYIYNALIDHCRKQNYQLSFKASDCAQSDESRSIYDVVGTSSDFDESAYTSSILEELAKCKAKYSGITRKGVEAIEMKILGYPTREIADHYQTTVNNVNAWIARARSKLKSDPDLIQKIK